ncbi:MAG TPA: glycosyltransferase family 2 protein [Phycisphaerae bacterium]|jgi:dolichol-phosphate mannosyltransferase
MKILIAVPVFNEEKYVAPVLREIRKYARAAALSSGPAVSQIKVLVVDDGSTDATPALLRDLAKRGHIDLLTHPENRGYGQSLIDAFSYADAHGFDWVITMDCDEQHEPCRVPLFVRECLKDDADVISGSRYLQPLGQGDGEGTVPADRRNINRMITELLNSTLTLNISCTDGDPAARRMTDSFCGFKAHRVSAMQRMNLTIPGYAFPMQFWAQAAALGLRIREMPVKLIYKDATRHFGGLLDDPTVRLQHYLQVLTNEIRTLREVPVAAGAETPECLCATD